MKTKREKRFLTDTPLGVQAIRQGLVSVVPVLLVRAFALVLRSLPVPAYQQLIHQGGGVPYLFLNSIYNVTFGLLSLFITGTIGYHFAALQPKSDVSARLGCPIASMACFVLFTGIDQLSVDTLGPKGMFLAILSALCASSIFCALLKSRPPVDLMTDGADAHFSSSMRRLAPLAVTVVLAASANQLLLALTGGKNAHALLLETANGLFALTGDGAFRGFLFVFLSSVLWFFGIHGSDILEGVSASVFAPATEINIALAAAGKAPTEILTKPFFDVFVLMGGCGSAMCLLLALLLFSRRHSSRRLAGMTALPMLFNINEIMIFGLPVIYNPTLLIPFLCTPLICFATTYAAMALGIVPLVTASVEWTTPVLIGGYLATGSPAGALLQLFNLVLGVMLYRPFVLRYDRERKETAVEDYNALVDRMKESESSRAPVKLMQLPGAQGVFAKALAFDLERAMQGKELSLYYQPQYRLDGSCLGAEALLRWNHPLLGMVYPPLVMQLAQEAGTLEELEKRIVARSLEDVRRIRGEFNAPLKISVNVTGVSLQNPDFVRYLIELAEQSEDGAQICLELTEQAAIQFNKPLQECFSLLRKAGYRLAIDDFSMGNTSLQYLQGSYFDLVKLDGSLVRQSLSNSRSLEIVSSIVSLSKSLGFQVLAEYISTEELRDNMARAGCTLYQGWLYAPAMPLEDFVKRLKLEGVPEPAQQEKN
ncbi:MAG: EAL domain-containing protein [Oscillospiraceae bacterium]|nr:EAL domain-containing protein [Oscillospiraceae bacterium]